MKELVVIDTDPGVDDLLALAYAYTNKLPVQAVTTVYGNSTLANVTRNAAYVVKALGSKWRIYPGAGAPLVGLPRVAECHGSSGLGNLDSTLEALAVIDPKSAQAFFDKLAKSTDKIALLCLGPMTNLATSIKNKTGFIDNISQLIIIGGAFTEKGNVTEFAEFNVYNDPLAFKLVINEAYKKNIDTTVIPVEVCRQVLLTKDDLGILEKTSLLPNIRQIVEPFLEYYTSNALHGGYQGAVLYDVLVPLLYERPYLFKSNSAKIEIEVLSGKKYGKTTCIIDPQSSIKVCEEIDAVKAKRYIMRALKKF